VKRKVFVEKIEFVPLGTKEASPPPTHHYFFFLSFWLLVGCAISLLEMGGKDLLR
jgi:hypothetical protein